VSFAAIILRVVLKECLLLLFLYGLSPETFRYTVVYRLIDLPVFNEVFRREVHTRNLFSGSVDDPQRKLKASFKGIRGCIQKFPVWPSGARFANGTALCHEVQLHRYFVSQSSEFCRHNRSCCF
jgi:hypothetical protein